MLYVLLIGKKIHLLWLLFQMWLCLCWLWPTLWSPRPIWPSALWRTWVYRLFYWLGTIRRPPGPSPNRLLKAFLFQNPTWYIKLRIIQVYRENILISLLFSVLWILTFIKFTSMNDDVVLSDYSCTCTIIIGFHSNSLATDLYEIVFVCLDAELRLQLTWSQ